MSSACRKVREMRLFYELKVLKTNKSSLPSRFGDFRVMMVVNEKWITNVKKKKRWLREEPSLYICVKMKLT